MIHLMSFILILFSILYGQTTDQINQAKSFIKNTGMSENQARQAAKARGYSDDQINDLIKKEKSKNKKPTTENFVDPISPSGLKNRSNEQDISQNTKENQPSLNGESLPIQDEDMLEIVDESNSNIESAIDRAIENIDYFGYDIFKRDPALFQASSVGTVDPDYLIGPGDEIIIMLWEKLNFDKCLQSIEKALFLFQKLVKYLLTV